VRVAGIRHAGYDRWLHGQLPQAPPRITIPIASLPASPFTKARRALTRDHGPPADLSADDPAVPLPVRAAVAALRYKHAAMNLLRLRRLIRRGKPDVLLVNNGGYPGGESCRYACIAARAEGVERVVHFVHNMAYPPNWPPRVERAIDARVDRSVDAWATAAHRASAALHERRGMTPEKVHTVHYGIEPPPSVTPGSGDELGFAEDALNVACVAAFEPRKGHLVLLDALREMLDADVPVRCALVGTGPEEQRVRRRAAELGLAEHVRFLGWRDDVDAILAGSDALVLASLDHECLPYVILEAMAHGLPVVGTDIAGIPEEIEDGRTGRVVPPGDAGAIAAALGELARDPSRRRDMGEAGRRRARSEFTVDRMVDAVVGLWE
jgi:glycosyltransferase involved in cell wall biosynthesis